MTAYYIKSSNNKYRLITIEDIKKYLLGYQKIQTSWKTKDEIDKLRQSYETELQKKINISFRIVEYKLQDLYDELENIINLLNKNSYIDSVYDTSILLSIDKNILLCLLILYKDKKINLEDIKIFIKNPEKINTKLLELLGLNIIEYSGNLDIYFKFKTESWTVDNPSIFNKYNLCDRVNAATIYDFSKKRIYAVNHLLYNNIERMKSLSWKTAEDLYRCMDYDLPYTMIDDNTNNTTKTSSPDSTHYKTFGKGFSQSYCFVPVLLSTNSEIIHKEQESKMTRYIRDEYILEQGCIKNFKLGKERSRYTYNGYGKRKDIDDTGFYTAPKFLATREKLGDFLKKTISHDGPSGTIESISGSKSLTLLYNIPIVQQYFIRNYLPRCIHKISNNEIFSKTDQVIDSENIYKIMVEGFTDIYYTSTIYNTKKDSLNDIYPKDWTYEIQSSDTSGLRNILKFISSPSYDLMLYYSNIENKLPFSLYNYMLDYDDNSVDFSLDSNDNVYKKFIKFILSYYPIETASVKKAFDLLKTPTMNIYNSDIRTGKQIDGLSIDRLEIERLKLISDNIKFRLYNKNNNYYYKIYDETQISDYKNRFLNEIKKAFGMTDLNEEIKIEDILEKSTIAKDTIELIYGRLNEELDTDISSYIETWIPSVIPSDTDLLNNNNESLRYDINDNAKNAVTIQTLETLKSLNKKLSLMYIKKFLLEYLFNENASADNEFECLLDQENDTEKDLRITMEALMYLQAYYNNYTSLLFLLFASDTYEPDTSPEKVAEIKEKILENFNITDEGEKNTIKELVSMLSALHKDSCDNPLRYHDNSLGYETNSHFKGAII